MTDIPALLRRQAEWQKSRAALSWPEKIRIAERLRDDVARLRRREIPHRSPPKTDDDD